jgi:aspartyl-tRNA(Asn)/glutamyl-tRNA(Gln) amidotransferase subunit A
MMLSYNSIAKAHAAYRERELMPRELLAECLANLDAREADLQAWVLVDREGAIEQANEQGQWLLSADRTAPLPPLFGIPIGVKDIIDVARLTTKAGSPLRSNTIASRDAELVTRLRNAGAIIVGKTITTEFACFDPSSTRNPWHRDHTPGGSSSGSAAAVATGACLAAIGSQTGGSILRPASYCGVVGFKPSHGLVPVDGVVPVAPTLDHVGPLSRTVADAARVFGVMAGGVSTSQAQRSSEAPPRFGVLRSFFLEHAEPETAAVFGAVLVHLENNVGPVADAQFEYDLALAHRTHRTIMAYECAQYHRELFGRHRDQYGRHVAALIEEGLNTSPEQYTAALSEALAFRDAVGRLLQSCDVLAMPTTPGPAPGIETTGDPRWQSPWSLARLPAITLPCGFAQFNLPLGLQLVGGDDAQLLAIAAQCEDELDLTAEIERLMQ